MYGEGADPRNATLKTGETVSGPGILLVNDGTTNTVETTDATDICIGVSAGDSTRDVDGNLQTSAGALVSYYPLGGVLMVQSAGSQTYTTGVTVYVGASGQATATAGSNKKLGLYVGEGAASVAAGTMIPVMTAGAAIA
tara:strand:+ start:3025 stop:3441 length:417 start_codon:yes stop_codon:yes gene_type:complete